MVQYEVGGYIHGEKRTYNEGIRFDINNTGNIVVYFNNPTPDEINEFKEGRVKLGYFKYKNVLMLLVKVGNLQWMDAPYSVHLSKVFSINEELEKEQGLAMVVSLVDARTGEIKTLRLLGANHRLSCSLIKDIKNQKEMPFDDYDKNISYLFSTYSTKELVSRATMLENLIVQK